MHFTYGNILLTASILPGYNLALRHIGLSPVRELRVTRTDDSAMPPTDIRVQLSWPMTEWRIPMPSCASGQTTESALPLGALDSRLLESVTRPESAQLRISLGSHDYDAAIEILGAWDWPSFPDGRISLGAYVLPADPAICRLLADTTTNPVDPTSIPGQRPTEADSRLRSLYESLQANRAIEYLTPLTVRMSPELSYQSVRRPHDVLSSPTGHGNCLDVSLVLAGALEAAGLAPTLVLLGERPDEFSHALTGVWRNTRSYQPPRETDRITICDQLESGNLLAVEATGVCRGLHSLSYSEARRRAFDLIKKSPVVEIINVRSCRPPLGRVLPLQLAHDPTVRHAEDLAEALGNELKRPMLETLHLLYGLLAAKGEICERLQLALEWQPARALEAIRQTLGRRMAGSTRGRTKGYERCLADAEDNARRRGTGTMQEGDLWWALLRSRNPSVDAILDFQSPDRRLLERELALLHSESGMMTEV